MNDERDPRATALLVAATRDLGPGDPTLVAAAVSRGRALRRRRRLQTTLAAAAVIGVIGAAASVAPRVLGGGDGATSVATAPAPSAPQSAEPVAPRRIGIDQGKATAVLMGLLPPGEAAPESPGTGSDDPDGPYRDGLVNFEGAWVSIHIEHPVLHGEDALPETMCRTVLDAECREVDGGEWLGVVRRELPGSGGVLLSVSLHTTDGFVITAIASNLISSRDDVVGPDPVLDEQELTDIVTAPVWLDEQQ